jgi:hypothetical protein
MLTYADVCSAHFNAVVASVRERNVALVNSLAVAYLQVLRMLPYALRMLTYADVC